MGSRVSQDTTGTIPRWTDCLSSHEVKAGTTEEEGKRQNSGSILQALLERSELEGAKAVAHHGAQKSPWTLQPHKEHLLVVSTEAWRGLTWSQRCRCCTAKSSPCPPPRICSTGIWRPGAWRHPRSEPQTPEQTQQGAGASSRDTMKWNVTDHLKSLNTCL